MTRLANAFHLSFAFTAITSFSLAGCQQAADTTEVRAESNERVATRGSASASSAEVGAPEAPFSDQVWARGDAMKFMADGVTVSAMCLSDECQTVDNQLRLGKIQFFLWSDGSDEPQRYSLAPAVGAELSLIACEWTVQVPPHVILPAGYGDCGSGSDRKDSRGGGDQGSEGQCGTASDSVNPEKPSPTHSDGARESGSGEGTTPATTPDFEADGYGPSCASAPTMCPRNIDNSGAGVMCQIGPDGTPTAGLNSCDAIQQLCMSIVPGSADWNTVITCT